MDRRPLGHLAGRDDRRGRRDRGRERRDARHPPAGHRCGEPLPRAAARHRSGPYCRGGAGLTRRTADRSSGARRQKKSGGVRLFRRAAAEKSSGVPLFRRAAAEKKWRRLPVSRAAAEKSGGVPVWGAPPQVIPGRSYSYRRYFALRASPSARGMPRPRVPTGRGSRRPKPRRGSSHAPTPRRPVSRTSA